MASFVFCIGLVGPPKVGKTGIFLRFTSDSFSENYVPTEDRYPRSRIIQSRTGHLVTLKLWEDYSELTGRRGQEHPIPYRSFHAFVIVMDLSQQDYDRGGRQYLEFIQRGFSPNDTPPLLFLVGTKCDVALPKSYHDHLEALEFAGHLPYFEVSSKTSLGVEDFFAVVADQLVERELLIHPPNPTPGDPKKCVLM